MTQIKSWVIILPKREQPERVILVSDHEKIMSEQAQHFQKCFELEKSETKQKLRIMCMNKGIGDHDMKDIVDEVLK